ncbi:MAG: ABC transporter permease, partial [Desulfuromonadales bacterium]|nr:ABC transporter permease [Desulfuromonadales bacterium]
MVMYALKRIFLALLVALTVSILTFTILNMTTDPAVAMAGDTATDFEIESITIAYGFDQPMPYQYVQWLGNALQGDLGTSYYFRTPVTALISGRISITLWLGLVSMAVGILIAVPLGVIAAIRPNSIWDRICLTLAVSAQALPSFWFALMLIVLLSVTFPILPSSGTDTWVHFIMPVFVLATRVMPAIMRLTRTGMLDVLASDYIRTARAKGLKPQNVLFKHALRNAVVPVVSVSSVQLGHLLTGSIVIETIFALHGVGFLAYESTVRNDLPTMQALVLLFSCIFIIATL